MCDLDHKKMQVKVVSSPLQEQQECFGDECHKCKLSKRLLFLTSSIKALKLHILEPEIV